MDRHACTCALALSCLIAACSDSKDSADGGARPSDNPAGSTGSAGDRARSGSGASSGGAAQLDAAVARDAAAPQRDAAPSGAVLDAAADAASDAAAPASSAIHCAARSISGDATMRFHHVHFNTRDADQDRELFDKLFATKTIEWCRDDESGEATWATKTDRGYFLYSEVAQAPDPTLNTYLEHVGWIHPNPNMELLRLVALDAPLYPAIRAQCPEAFAGQMACGFDGYWFYLQAPSGARIEVAKGPGPATMGFGHVHMIMGVDFTWLETVTNGAFHDGAIDMVNHTAVSLDESILASETVVPTRGKPIDHLAYSTTMLDAEYARIKAAGIAIAEEISFRPEYGFRSFFLEDAKGIWYEIVEDSAFTP